MWPNKRRECVYSISTLNFHSAYQHIKGTEISETKKPVWLLFSFSKTYRISEPSDVLGWGSTANIYIIFIMCAKNYCFKHFIQIIILKNAHNFMRWVLLAPIFFNFFFNKYLHCTVQHNPQLVESMDVKPWTLKADCKSYVKVFHCKLFRQDRRGREAATHQSPGTVISASKIKELINDSPKGRMLKQFG